ncbi:LIM domain-containing protein A-like [Cynoglossus semilaevis]|uniref:LIM domain-containing protein A-like n=1 Tax=Cynoglossus semilaevis TaxID=244447 RepID=UPI000D624F3A|nr:LIM domain-containing protein A-like [Cynoglossus semilaevis]
MCDPRRKDHKQGTDVPLKCRQYCDRNDDRVIKDVPSRSEGNIFNDDHDDHGCPSHRDKSSQFLFEHPKPSPCHATLSTAACSAFSYSSSSSSSSSSFSSFFSSSSSASSSSVNSNTSSECRVRCAFKKPWYSQSCTDISEKRGYFEEDCDTAPLIEMKGSKRGSAKNKLATQSPVQECLPKTRTITSGSKTDGNVRKSKSMEALVRPKDKGGHEDENEQGMRESDARKELVKEKMKFSAFLNEITRQVLSPVRLTTLGVKDAHPSCGPPQACGQSEKSEKRQRSQSASADSPASNQNVRSRKQPSVNQPPSKSFHQNPMHNPAHSAALSVSPRTGSSTDVRCLKSPQAHRHQKHYNHQHKGEHAFTPHCHESRNCNSQCHHPHHHHHHHQTHNSAYHPEDLHNTFPNGRGHNKLHPHGDHPQEEHHLRHHRHGGHHHGDPHHRDHEQGGYCYADHHRRRHCSETGDSSGPTPPFGHCRRRCHKNHRSDDYHMDCGDEHGPALHHGGNSVANDSDCTTRRRDGRYSSTKEDRALRLLGDHDSESQISSEREADRPGHIRDHHLDHHSSSDRDGYQRSGYQRCRHNSYSDSHHHHHRHQHGNYGCSDHQLNHDDCISRAHRHYRKNTIKSPPQHHHHHHHHDRRHQSEAYSHHHVNHHYGKPHPYHHGNQPHSESHQRHYASPCVEHRQKVHALGLQDNADARGRRSPFSCSSPAHGKLETESAMTTRSPSSHDVEQMSFLDSSSIHKEETHETGRIM